MEIFDSREKLVIQEIRNITLPRRLVATYDDHQFYCLQSTNVINLRQRKGQPNLKFLLGILNSNAANYFFRQRFPGNNHIPSNQLAQIPVPKTEQPEHDRIVSLVDQVLSTKRRDPESDTSALEQEIDRLVYRLYDLTSDEIRLVEEGVRG